MFVCLKIEFWSHQSFQNEINSVFMQILMCNSSDPYFFKVIIASGLKHPTGIISSELLLKFQFHFFSPCAMLVKQNLISVNTRDPDIALKTFLVCSFCGFFLTVSVAALFVYTYAHPRAFYIQDVGLHQDLQKTRDFILVTKIQIQYELSSENENSTLFNIFPK